MRPLLFLTLLLAALSLGACAPGSPASLATSSADEISTYRDPFAYCATVGTVDAPDARYDGADMPDAIVKAMIQQGVVTADAPREFQEHAVWRCMGGQVWACHFGANLPCQEKADMSQEPDTAMDEFCTANPSAESIPAAVTGRATVYAWRCIDGKAQAGDQILSADPQGFLAEFWYPLDAQQ
jgi:hypothetical protein